MYNPFQESISTPASGLLRSPCFFEIGRLAVPTPTIAIGHSPLIDHHNAATLGACEMISGNFHFLSEVLPFCDKACRRFFLAPSLPSYSMATSNASQGNSLAPALVISRLMSPRIISHRETSRARACFSKKSRCTGSILAVTTSEHRPFRNLCILRSNTDYCI